MSAASSKWDNLAGTTKAPRKWCWRHRQQRPQPVGRVQRHRRKFARHDIVRFQFGQKQQSQCAIPLLKQSEVTITTSSHLKGSRGS